MEVLYPPAYSQGFGEDLTYNVKGVCNSVVYKIKHTVQLECTAEGGGGRERKTDRSAVVQQTSTVGASVNMQYRYNTYKNRE